MRLSLIGMSGSCKSKKKKKLVEDGFKAFYCDDMIEQRLACELNGPDGRRLEVGQWMGFPYEDGYRRRESKYLSYEKSVLADILSMIDNFGGTSWSNLVIDTTGSVIYVGDEILTNLRRLTTVVHLETPPEVQDQMLAAYLENRRPVLWRNFFNKDPDETNDAALARCYSLLLSRRERLYRQWADITIDYATHSKKELSSGEFIEMIIDRYGKLMRYKK